jgi:RNA polymerase sigma-70 factor (ECF subfamily)
MMSSCSVVSRGGTHITRFGGESGKVSGSEKNSFLSLPTRPVYPVPESGADSRFGGRRETGRHAGLQQGKSPVSQCPKADTCHVERAGQQAGIAQPIGLVGVDGERPGWRSRRLSAVARTDRAVCPVDRGEVLQDVVQDVLLTVHAIRNAYDPKRPFGPWLVAIANRRMIDRLRRHARQKAREIELSVEHETFPDASANLDRTTSAELALAGAIDKLPPDQREAIRMLKLNEMSLKEASHASGRSIAALKVATHRAIRNLRHLLRGQRP